MENFGFQDGNISTLVESRCISSQQDETHGLQMHSSLIRRLSLEKELEGHQGCVNALSWSSSGTLLLSGSDDTRLNVWDIMERKLLHSLDTGHSANIFCAKFVPETSDELVVSGAGDADVRIFNLSCLQSCLQEGSAVTPLILYHCHSRRVKKLALETGNPNVVWSASEDGTLRQHDFRECTSCPPAGASRQECRSVLLDLRNGAKRSLADPPKHTLALKSCDISVARPHLVLVGGSDAFARLYDRRMLPSLSSFGKKTPPPPVVNYLCPMHLAGRGQSSLHLTHVTFSPSSEEGLLTYSGEHVYLMSINGAHAPTMKYNTGDITKLMRFTPILNGLQLHSALDMFKNGHCSGRHTCSKVDRNEKLMEIAKRFINNGSICFYGIEACNEALDGRHHDMCPDLRHDFLCTRAALLLKRRWKNDAHMAIRDCYSARKINNSSIRALCYMSDALSQLGRHKDALDFAVAAQCFAPSDTQVAEKVERSQKNIAAVEAAKNKSTSERAPEPESQSGRVLSLIDILHAGEADPNALPDVPRSEREDSDNDEGLELTFETSVSGEEDHGPDLNASHGSLNIRIHRSESGRETNSSNSPHGSPPPANDSVPYQPEPVIDMRQQYVGHCNIGTDIKQATFLGQNGDYIASGSDDGRWFIWEKKSSRLIKILSGDEAVVNCVQCHPFECMVATSGIDSTVKIWSPCAYVPSMVSGGAAGPASSDILEIMESNQRRLIHNREAVIPLAILEQFRMHEFGEGTLQPFECTQS